MNENLFIDFYKMKKSEKRERLQKPTKELPKKVTKRITNENLLYNFYFRVLQNYIT